MAETKIPWAHYTFNGWIGCAHAGPECDHCYAEAWANRFPRTRGLWGADAARLATSDGNWSKPRAWNEAALRAGERRRVFASSLCDVLEAGAYLDQLRARLWATIEATPALDWLLLSKRPAGYATLTPAAWRKPGGWPSNVWAGTTCGTSAGLARVRTLISSAPGAPVRFVSAEPQLEAIDWTGVLSFHDAVATVCGASAPSAATARALEAMVRRVVCGIDWLIIGGESGGQARPFDLAWLRVGLAQAGAAGIAAFTKQLGAFPVDSDHVAGTYAPEDRRSRRAAEAFDAIAMLEDGDFTRIPNLLLLNDPKGEDPSEWPPEFNLRQVPLVAPARPELASPSARPGRAGGPGA